MGVFLRWGVFGIVVVAALLYAYNASKRLAGKREADVAQVVSPEDPDEEAESTEPDVVEPTASGPAGVSSAAEDGAIPAMPPECEEERLVAERALKFLRDGEPLDRLLRIQVIAFQTDEARRARLETVARQWFEREGRDPNAAALRSEVLRDCRSSRPAN